MELDRVDILRSLSTEKNAYFVTDKELNHRIKNILEDFDKPVFDLKEPVAIRLKRLFQEKEFSVIRALFQNSFLIHRTDVLETHLGNNKNGFLFEVQKKTKANRDKFLEPLVNELNNYSSSNYKVIELMIRKFLRIFHEIHGGYGQIIKNNRLNYNLKLLAVDEFVILNRQRLAKKPGNRHQSDSQNKEMTKYLREANFTWGTIVDFLIYESNRKHASRELAELSFIKIIEPLNYSEKKLVFNNTIEKIKCASFARRFEYSILRINASNFKNWLMHRKYEKDDLVLLKHIIRFIEANELQNLRDNEAILMNMINRSNQEFKTGAINLFKRPVYNWKINEILKSLNIRRNDFRLRGWLNQNKSHRKK